MSAGLVLALASSLADSQMTPTPDPTGVYVGGAIGQSRVEATSQFWFDSFSQYHTGFKAIAGYRPIRLIGAEVEYIDFGHPSGTVDLGPADVRMHGVAAFGVAHLSMPFVDGFVKGGVSRLDSTTRGVIVASAECFSCQSNTFELKRTSTNFAAGGGVQSSWGDLSGRLEYEFFQAAGGYPRLLSVGITWTFF